MKAYRHFFIIIIYCLNAFAVLPAYSDNESKEINNVKELPLSMQFNNTELSILKNELKAMEPIRFDKDGTEPIVCDNCGIFFYGVSLLPPYYITRSNDKLYINGYEIYPQRRSTRLTSEKYRKSLRTKKPEEKLRKITGEKNMVRILFNELLEKSKDIKDQNAREAWVRDQLKKEGIETEWISIKKNVITILYNTNKIKSGTITTYIDEKPRQREMKINREHSKKDTLEYLIRNGISDGKIHFIHSSGSWKEFGMAAIVDIIDKIESSKDDRYLIDELNGIYGLSDAIYIVANKEAFLSMLKELVNE